MIGIDAIANLVSTTVDKIFPDANIEAQGKVDAMKAQLTQELQSVMGQLEINKEEAKNPSMFVSGARPFIMWVCGTALAYAALLEPIGRFIAVVGFDYAGTFPVINTDITMQILFGLLGLGGYRTVEKLKGVARHN
jgi:hypothetical protein